MKNLFSISSFCFSAFLSTIPINLGPAPEDCSAAADLEGNCAAYFDRLSMANIQAVGSHNSYKIAIPAPELAMIAQKSSPQQAESLDYGHVPIADQLALGMRQIELDVYYDPEGGRYSNPLLPRTTAHLDGSQPYNNTHMDTPGFKVFHVQDIDVRSHCALFVQCLSEIDRWSKANPSHVPILIMLNTKQSTPGKSKDLVTALAFDEKAFDALDAEIRSVFGADRLITPDDIRGTSETLNGAVRLKGWPVLAEARGKIIFALDENETTVNTYMRGHPSLEGLPMFVNSVCETAPHAAYFTLNNPIAQQQRIQTAVKAGFLVRTRADADTREARTNDTRRRQDALNSGAQYISTDYYLARPKLSEYRVGLPKGQIARCNPVRSSAPCK